MSPHEDAAPELDDRLLDLLADGELSDAERRQLLARLDDAPGGWRRCALAFLEAQSWQSDLGAIARERAPAVSRPAVSPPVVAVAAKASRPRRQWLGRAASFAAIAASLMAAVTIGYMARDAWREPFAPRLTDFAAQPETRSAAPFEGGWQTVAVPLGGRAGSVEIPAATRDALDAEWFEHLGETVPPHVLEALERTGHRVARDRRLVPMRMDDGRQLVVPVDQVDIRYVGNPGYQ